MQYASMQTLFDSLCQCLGSSPSLPLDGSDPPITGRSGGEGGSNREVSPRYGGGGVGTTPLKNNNNNNSPNGSRSPASNRASRLELKDKQWDALFDSGTPTKMMHTHKHGGGSNEESSPTRSGSRGGRTAITTPDQKDESGGGTPLPCMDTAHDLAKAKQAANPSRYRSGSSSPRDSPPHTTTSSSNTPTPSRSHKRKRPTSSRDDIFRSRKFGAPGIKGRTGCEGEGNCMNPISKFLSNHQGFASALCFATPVRDEDELEEELKLEEENNNGANNDNNSLASDAGTLNTCEDSMLMLDHKLAQMSKNQPPMPLFHDFKVNQNEPEGLRRIVNADSHSSTKLMRIWRDSQQQQQQQQQQAQNNNDNNNNNNLNGSNIVIPSSSSSSSSSSGAQRGRARVRRPPAPPVIPEDDGPPPMMAKSSSSSGESCRSHLSRQVGEI